MSFVATGNRTATRDEVIARRGELRRLAAQHGLLGPRVDALGTIIVGSPQPGYAAITRFATAAAELTGAWVNVIADGVPAAEVAAEAL